MKHLTLHNATIGFLSILLGLFSSVATAVDVTLLGGSQGGGDIEYISTGSTLDFADEAVHGLIFSIPRSHNKDLELFYSQQQTRLEEGGPFVPPSELMELDIHYLHLGGSVMSEKLNGLQGFLSGGLGITHFSPSLQGAAAENKASLSLGAGARWMLSDRVGLRLEGRMYGTLFDSNTLLFCSGGCAFSVSGELLTQYAIFGGVVVHFD